MESIRIEKLNKFYGKKWVLKNVDLRFYEGEIVAIMGPNASGKTTLIKSIMGLVKPSSGRIYVLNNDVSKTYEYKKYIGYMLQYPEFPENLTPLDLFKLLKEVHPKSMDYEKYVGMFKLEEFLEIPIKNLSGGTKQKINACLCLSIDAKIYILDEPTSSLDPQTSYILKEEIYEKRNNGATVIFSTHIIPTAEEMASRIVYLYEGYVKYDGTPEDLKRLKSENTLVKALAKLI